MENKICMRYFVSGKVQGVWFRAATQEQALMLDVTGWARNLPDGRVEVLACGTKDKLLQLLEWLKQGPELAEVLDVSYEELPLEKHTRFAIQ